MIQLQIKTEIRINVVVAYILLMSEFSLLNKFQKHKNEKQ